MIWDSTTWVNFISMLLCGHLKCSKWHNNGAYATAFIDLVAVVLQRFEEWKHVQHPVVFSHYSNAVKRWLRHFFFFHLFDIWKFKTVMNGCFNLNLHSFFTSATISQIVSYLDNNNNPFALTCQVKYLLKVNSTLSLQNKIDRSLYIFYILYLWSSFLTGDTMVGHFLLKYPRCVALHKLPIPSEIMVFSVTQRNGSTPCMMLL